MKKRLLSILMSISMVIGIISVNAVSITFDDISEEQETNKSDKFQEFETCFIEKENSEMQNETILINEEIQTTSLEATNNEIMTTAVEDGTLEYVKTVNGYGYTASIHCDANSRYWNINTGYKTFSDTTTYGATYSSTVPLFNNIYLTKGSLIKFNLFGGSCGHSPSYANIYINGNYFNKLYIAPYGNGVSSQQILYFKVEKSGNYNATAIGCAIGCSVSGHHGIYILPSYDIYRYKYDISYNLNGSTLSKENPTYYYEEDGDIVLNNPTKTGYTFLGWTGTDLSFPTKNITIPSGSMGSRSYTANFQVNKYPVTYIDVVKQIGGTELGRTVKQVDYNTNVRGGDLGSSIADNAYYNNYFYISDTVAIVTTSGATVYRIFDARNIEKTVSVVWNDNNNSDNLRPSKYTLTIYQNGNPHKTVKLSSNQTTYTFTDLPQYDENGNPYSYIVGGNPNSDRYDTDINDSSITFNYKKANFNVTIPKKITLDGNTGKANYITSVNGTFYYNDTLTVKPNKSFVLTDRSNISNMTGYVNQIKTGFTKEDLPFSADGNISVNRNYFAGKWNGYFNFEIKFVMKN